MTNKRTTASTKERILSTAGDIFASQGYRTATIRKIAKAAHVNIAAVNYHFGGKEELYATVLEEVFRSGFSRFPGKTDDNAGKTPEERLRYFIRAMFQRLLSSEGWNGTAGQGRLIARELLDPSPVFERVIATYIRPHKDLLAQIIIAVIGRDPGPEKLLSCAISIMGQCIYYALATPVIRQLSPVHTPSPTNLEQLADTVWLFSLGGISKIAGQND